MCIDFSILTEISVVVSEKCDSGWGHYFDPRAGHQSGGSLLRGVTNWSVTVQFWTH